jgi:hypothetical protein
LSEIINLRRTRKERARIEGDKEAAANRLLFGTPKSIRNIGAAETRKQVETIEAHRLEKLKDRKD